MDQAIQEMIEEIRKDEKDLDKIKKEIAHKYSLKHFPSTVEILSYLTDEEKEKFKHKFIIKPVRTISGVAPLALMTMPDRCPHGTCTFCPGGKGSFFGDVPQSYTGNEPSTMRAIRANYDPYLIVFNRLEQYTLLNQIPEKVEVIIQGGTFPAFSKEYQDYFIKYTFKALNDFSEMFFVNGEFDFEIFKEFFELPGDKNNKERTKRIHEKLLNIKGQCELEKEQLRNETAKIRCTLLCVETKPDWCFEDHINEMLKLGTTRVEIGVQTIYDEVLKKTNRGHTVEDTLRAIQLAKDSFLKCVFHVMPGLPNVTKEQDVECFKEYFNNNFYKPDGLKIYPCMVMPGTALWVQYKAGRFKPITTEEAAEIISEGKRFIEPYCRVHRVQRDIPTNVTEAGVDRTNLRQYVFKKVKDKKILCKCIRCREPMSKKIDFDHVELKRIDYDASNGKEVFLSFEDTKNDLLLGFLRLRKPYKPFRPEITSDSVGIREIHVYGEATSLGKVGKVQHRGFGKRLMVEAERIAKEDFNAKKILVLSGIGTKEYFRKLGYENDGIYMRKFL